MILRAYVPVCPGPVVGPLVELDDDVKPESVFPKDVASCLHSCDADVREGWQYDGKTFVAPTEQSAQLESQPALAPRDFIALFTSSEQQAIFTAQQTSWEVAMFITLVTAGPVDLKNEEVIKDVRALVSMNLMKPNRADDVLAGRAPSSE